MKINGKTKIFGISGNPVSHSLSPLLHNYFLKKNKLPFVYIPLGGVIDKPKDLNSAIKSFSIEGLSVTIPYKEIAMEAAEKKHSSVLLAGSANTLIYNKKKNIITAYNTDGKGALLAIKNKFFQSAKANNSKNKIHNIIKSTNKNIFKNSFVFIFGNGGTARGILASLYLEKPAAVFIVARNTEKALDFKNDFCKRLKKNNFNYNNNIYIINWEKIKDLNFSTFLKNLNIRHKNNLQTKANKIENQNLQNILNKNHNFKKQTLTKIKNKIFLINTTPIGMSENSIKASFPLSTEFILSNMLLFDAVYKPALTPFLKLGKEKKCKLVYGKEMLLYQALEQMRLFYKLDSLPEADEYRKLLEKN